MKRDEVNTKFREYARTLSPKEIERDLVSKTYKSFCDLLGENNCLQIGSYPRFTAITPVHDLDILYILENWDEDAHNSSEALENLIETLKNNYENPTNYTAEFASRQTHSVGVLFKDASGDEIISVDIIPSYIFSTNEFGEDTYKIPEVAKKRHGSGRNDFYQELSREHKEMGWISSDPRGYIKVASETDTRTNGEFRKTIKIIKRWKDNLADENENLKLKSFHIEQVVTEIFNKNQSADIFEAMFTFFFELPEVVATPNQINDRMNYDKFIDDYLAELTSESIEQIRYARDGFLRKLEALKGSDSMESLLQIDFYKRKNSEEFLFDKRIKTFIDTNLRFKADGFVKPLSGHSHGWLSESIPLQKGLTRGGERKRMIEFSVRTDIPSATEHRWKVKNSDSCEQPRGEITLNQTKNHPESTEYVGDHYVECYAIQGGICIARSRVNVKII
ncbi:MAG: hypothetical protein ABIJ72_00120 [bacterium]